MICWNSELCHQVLKLLGSTVNTWRSQLYLTILRPAGGSWPAQLTALNFPLLQQQDIKYNSIVHRYMQPCFFTTAQANPWRRQWQSTPVLLPEESQGWRSLVGCCPWGCTELDTTEATQQQHQQANPGYLFQQPTAKTLQNRSWSQDNWSLHYLPYLKCMKTITKAKVQKMQFSLLFKISSYFPMSMKHRQLDQMEME